LSETARLLTRFVREKRWVPTSRKDALRLIQEEMPQTDAEATLAYIEAETARGKTVTLGECCFKHDKK